MEKRLNNFSFIGLLVFLRCLLPLEALEAQAAIVEITLCKGVSLTYFENEERETINDFCSQNDHTLYSDDVFVLNSLKSSRITFSCEYKDDKGNKIRKDHKFPMPGQTA